MFLIVMHNKDSYLDKVESILREKGIERISRITRDCLRVPTKDTEFISGVRFEASNANYDKAVVATVRQEKFFSLHEALQTIENSQELKKEKGFITTLPYEQIVEMAQERREAQMEISDYLRVKFVCSELKATNRDDAIRELADLLKGSPEILDFDHFVNDVFEREKVSTTGIGYQIAIPHARTSSVNKFVVAFGRSKNGIDFSSIDKQPVNLVFLMGIPADVVKGYLKILAYLTRLLKKEDFRTQLLDTKDAHGMIDIFKKKENNNK